MKNYTDSEELTYIFGVFVSLIVHLLGAVIAIIVLESASAQAARRPEVFTVTLEGGEKIGGISQVPKKEKKTKAPKVGGQKKKEKAPKVKKEAKAKIKKKIEAPTVVDELAKKKAAEKKKKEIAKKKKVEAKKKKEKERKRKLAEKRRKEKERKERNERLAEITRSLKEKSDYQGESVNAGGEGFGAARLGGKGMGGGTLASAEKVAYSNALQEHVKSGWRWLSGKEKLRALVLVRILRNGSVQDVNIVKSSGNQNFDDSVVRAVKKANPVPAPPEKYYRDFSQVRFWFDSHE